MYELESKALIDSSVLSREHVDALLWFDDRAGTNIPWPKPLGIIYLLNKAKGIQKPEGWDYALSVRKSLNSTYDDWLHWDEEGRWILRYAYEGDNPEYFTNKALRKCMLDRVPVAVVIQLKAKPNPLYRVLGLANVLLEDRNARNFTLSQCGPISARQADLMLDVALPDESFETTSASDARSSVMRSIARRRGNPRLRRRLIEAYGDACAISGSLALEVLEVAQIVDFAPHLEGRMQNSILLRSDLHTLFDLGFLGIDPETLCVRVSETISDPYYRQFDGRKLSQPSRSYDRPSKRLLAAKYKLFTA
jgi:hypothetical protein